MCVCARACVYACACAETAVSKRQWMPTHGDIVDIVHTSVCMSLCVDVWMCVCLCVCSCVCACNPRRGLYKCAEDKEPITRQV